MTITDSHMASACGRLTDKMVFILKNFGEEGLDVETAIGYLENYLAESVKDESGVAIIGDVLEFNKEVILRRQELVMYARKAIEDAYKTSMIDRILSIIQENGDFAADVQDSL